MSSTSFSSSWPWRKVDIPNLKRIHLQFLWAKIVQKNLFPSTIFKLNFQVIPLQFFQPRSHSGTHCSPSFSTCEALSPAHHWRPDNVVELGGEVSEMGRPIWNSWWCEGWTIPSFFWWLTYVFLMFFNIMQQTLLFSMTVHKYSMTRPKRRRNFLVWITARTPTSSTNFNVPGLLRTNHKTGAPSKTCIFLGWNNFIYEGLQTQLPNYSTQSVGGSSCMHHPNERKPAGSFLWKSYW